MDANLAYVAMNIVAAGRTPYIFRNAIDSAPQSATTNVSLPSRVSVNASTMKNLMVPMRRNLTSSCDRIGNNTLILVLLEDGEHDSTTVVPPPPRGENKGAADRRADDGSSGRFVFDERVVTILCSLVGPRVVVAVVAGNDDLVFVFGYTMPPSPAAAADTAVDDDEAPTTANTRGVEIEGGAAPRRRTDADTTTILHR